MTVIFRISHAAEPAFHARSILGAPMVIGDTMEPVQSMLDGKMYDSKRRLRETYRAAGVVEVGKDPAIMRKGPKPKPDRSAIKAAVGKAFSRVGFGA